MAKCVFYFPPIRNHIFCFDNIHIFFCKGALTSVNDAAEEWPWPRSVSDAFLLRGGEGLSQQGFYPARARHAIPRRHWLGWLGFWGCWVPRGRTYRRLSGGHRIGGGAGRDGGEAGQPGYRWGSRRWRLDWVDGGEAQVGVGIMMRLAAMVVEGGGGGTEAAPQREPVGEQQDRVGGVSSASCEVAVTCARNRRLFSQTPCCEFFPTIGFKKLCCDEKWLRNYLS